MELVLRQKPSTNYGWAAACGFIGLGLGPLNPLGLLTMAGAVVFGMRGLQASQGKEFLKIDTEGFTYKSFFREKHVAWADLESVDLLTYRYLGLIPYRRMVVYRYVPAKRGGAMRKAVGWVNGWDEMLPGTFGMKPKLLAALMEEHRRRADASSWTPSQTIV